MSTTQDILDQSPIYKRLRFIANSDASVANLLKPVHEAAERSVEEAKRVIKTLPEFTLHDSVHFSRVLRNMDIIIQASDQKLEDYSAPDLAVWILAAFMHDLGLAPTDRQLDAWLQLLEKRFDAPKGERTGFSHFLAGRPQEVAEYHKLRSDSDSGKAEDCAQRLVVEFTRLTHGERAREKIEKILGDGFTYKGVDLSGSLADICASHTDDALQLLSKPPLVQIDQGEFFSPTFASVLLRVADLLDLDSKRAPESLLKAISFNSEVSLAEWKKHVSITSVSIMGSDVVVAATCSHPVVEDSIRKFCDIIDNELRKSDAVLRSMKDPAYPSVPAHYRASLPKRVIRSKITAAEVRGRAAYSYIDARFNLNRDKIIDLLMGTSLYNDPSVALRELIQNSVDAIRVRQELEGAWDNPFLPKLSISIDRTSLPNTLTIQDNGIGMDEDIIVNYYATVGTSFYKSSEFYQLMANNGLSYVPISRFGIGVLSSFLVADSFELNTKRLIDRGDLGQPLKVKVNNVSQIFWIAPGNMADVGTRTTLLLRQDHPWVGKTSDEIILEFKRNFPSLAIGTSLSIDDEKVFLPASSAEPDSFHEEENWRSEYKAPGRVMRVAGRAVNLLHPASGVRGSVKIYWLEENNTPVDNFEYFNRRVEIEGLEGDHSLTNKLRVSDNAIDHLGTSFQMSDGESPTVTTLSSWRPEVVSDLTISLHGIRVPAELLPYESRGKTRTPSPHRAELQFPFVVRGWVDVGTPSDLNLNAARTDIIVDYKWNEFRLSFLRTILRALNGDLDDFYKRALFDLWRRGFREEWSRKLIESFL
jgi:hypothetical protein